MITGLFLLVLGSLLFSLTSVLPNASQLPAQVFEWVSYYHSGSQIVGTFLPLGQIYAVLGLIIIIEGILISYRISLFVFGLFRGGH